MRRLVKFMKARNITGQTLAKRLGVTPAAVYFWTSGKTVPSIKHAIKLDKLSGGFVSVYDWE